MIPTENIKACGLARARFGDLFFERDTNARVFVGGVDGERYAVFLDGQSAGRGFMIKDDQTRDGFVIRGAAIEIDHTSFVNGHLPDGSISVGTHGAQIIAKVAANGWQEGKWISLGELNAIGESLGSIHAFTRWRIVLPLRDGAALTLFEEAGAIT